MWAKLAAMRTRVQRLLLATAATAGMLAVVGPAPLLRADRAHRGDDSGNRAFTLAAEMRAEAHRVARAPSAVVHAPAGFDPQPPLHLVVFLHGFNGCAEVLMRQGATRCRPGDAERPGWNLAGHHDAASTNTLFVIPQLAFMRRDGDPGCFAKRGCFRRFVDELLSQTLAKRLGAPRTLRDVGSITLLAHSGGFESALAILEHGEVDAHIRAVVLFDALYAGTERFADWLLARERAGADARLLSMYAGSGGTRRESRKLLARVRRSLGPERALRLRASELEAGLAASRLLIAHARAAHRLVPERYMAEVLAALPFLPIRPASAAR